MIEYSLNVAIKLNLKNDLNMPWLVIILGGAKMFGLTGLTVL